MNENGKIPSPPPRPTTGLWAGLYSKPAESVVELLTEAVVADPAAFGGPAPPEVGVTPGHPNGVDSEVTLSEATAPPSLTLGQTATVEPGQGFPGRARRSDLKAEQKAELAEKRRQAKADTKVQRAEHKVEQRTERHQRKLDRIGRRKAERIPFAERVPAVAQPIPFHRSWLIFVGAVAVVLIIAAGTWRATGRGDLNVTAVMRSPQSETDTSGPPPSTPAVNPLASVGFPITPQAARYIGSGTSARPEEAKVTLANGQQLSLGVGALESVRFQLLNEGIEPCKAQLDSPDPAKAPRVVVGQQGAPLLFDCTPPPTTPTSRPS